MYRPGRILSDGIPTSQQDGTSRPPGLFDVCRDQCPICDEEKPSFSHVAHHLRRIAAFALPRSAILEDDIAPVSQDSNDANLESDEYPAERLSESELEDMEGVSSQRPAPTSLPQDHNQQYHPIPGLHHQLRSGKHSNQPVDTSNLLSSNAIKQLDHSSQTRLSIRDYLSDLDYDGSEQDAGQLSEINPPQASGAEPLVPFRPDRSEPSQPRDHQIIGSQFQDMTKKQKAKQTETTSAQIRKALDLEGSEQDAGQRSNMISPQASVAKLPAPSRPDGYTQSQSPDDRIVESQF